MEPIGIDVFEGRERVVGGDALLVNAYGPEWGFRAVRLEGAIPFVEFRRLFPNLSPEQEIIVYCA